MSQILLALGCTYLLLGWAEGQVRDLSEGIQLAGRNLQIALLYWLGWLYIAYGLTAGH